MYKTTDIDVRHAPFLLELCNAKLEGAILPVLSNAFDLPLDVIAIDDLFVVKYECAEEKMKMGKRTQTSLAPHRDDSVLSFVILLNSSDCFEEVALNL